MLEYNCTTTLREIRKASPCRDGWQKLLSHLGKTEADDDPLSLLTVLDSNGLDDALWVLDNAIAVERLKRHFQAWSAEQVLHLFEAQCPGDTRVRDQIAMLRNDSATDDERAASSAAARAAASAAASDAASAASSDTASAAARDAARDAAWAAASAAARAAASVAASDTASVAASAAASAAARRAARRAASVAACDACDAQSQQLRAMITLEKGAPVESAEPTEKLSQIDVCPECHGRTFAECHGGGLRCVECKKTYGHIAAAPVVPAPAVPVEGMADRLQAIADKRHKDDVRVLTIADADVIAKAADALRAQPAPQVKELPIHQWQPIKTAPWDGTLVLLGNTNDPQWALRCRRWQDTHWRGWDAEDATHWMSLQGILSALSGEAQPAPQDADQLRAENERLRDIVKMVDAWGNGLRHHSAHEHKMVKSARAALSGEAQR